MNIGDIVNVKLDDTFDKEYWRRRCLHIESIKEHKGICPWGKSIQKMCTPTRAEDCGQSNICGKTKKDL